MLALKLAALRRRQLPLRVNDERVGFALGDSVHSALADPKARRLALPIPENLHRAIANLVLTRQERPRILPKTAILKFDTVNNDEVFVSVHVIRG